MATSVWLGLVATLAVVVQAVALARLLASAMPGASPHHRSADLVALGAAVAVRALVAAVSEPLARLSAVSAKSDLRRRLVGAAVERAPAGAGRSPGELATLAGKGLDALDVYIGRCLPDLVLAMVAPVMLLVAVGILDWPSALVLVVAVGLFPVFGALVGRASSSLATARWQQVEAFGRRVSDVFEGLPVLRAFGRSGDQRGRIAEASAALAEASMATLRVAFLSALVLDTLASVSMALVAVPLGLRLLHGDVPLPDALAVLVVAPEVLLPLRRASAEFHESTEGLAAASHALDLLPRAAPPARCPPRRPGDAPDPCRVPVTLDQVTVLVPGRRRPVLDRLTFSIEPGETVALVGPNGAGKSTVVSLLLGFLAPSGGLVTVGGTDLATIDLDAWRARLTYQPSHPALLAATVAENLRLARPHATDDELEVALRRAGGSDLLAALPKGLETVVGDGGRSLSAGERQRLALARTLLRPASLFVLDEPTVHLDEEAESVALHHLREALCGRSALFVTHRHAGLALADRVLTISEGRLVPSGAPSLACDLAGAP
ncbi:MAG TPA: thiol reductant ABC exporter subunit CydD [Acidimicrobiales bacterium]|nr:thiol reductant ABC exporter subunit CydD [Acidimicrobiales bacterium]